MDYKNDMQTKHQNPHHCAITQAMFQDGPIIQQRGE